MGCVCVWYVRVFVFGMSCMRIYDLVLVDRASCATHVRGIGLLTHACAYSLINNYIGDEGAQHIAAALAHNSTLQTLL
jgi:hypothetical protein